MGKTLLLLSLKSFILFVCCCFAPLQQSELKETNLTNIKHKRNF